MISLRRQYVAQKTLINGTNLCENLTKFPNPATKTEDTDEISTDICIHDKISRALHSKNIQLKIWGISAFSKYALYDKKSLQFLQIILNFLSTKDLLLENIVANCLLVLSKNIGKFVAAPILSPIINKLKENPAIEYTQIISNIIQYLTPTTIKCCILSMIENFLNNQNESYHYAAAELSISNSFDVLNITPDFFLKFLNSNVIINFYLTQMIRNASKTFSKEWIGKILPMHLLHIANDIPEFRYGILKTVLSISDIIFPKYFSIYISNALSCANDLNDVKVELILASKADEIISPKTIEFLPQIKNILYKISHSDEQMIRLLLPKIITSNPSAFFSSDFNLIEVFKSLANDKSQDIRMAFLDSFWLIFRLSSSWSVSDKETLKSLLIAFFKDPSPLIRSKLCSSIVYSTLGADRLISIIPHYIEMISFIQSWRLLSESIDTFLAWPNRAVSIFWIQVAPIVNKAAKKNPHSLASTVQSFYTKVSISLKPEMERKLEEIVITDFAKSTDFRMRELFPKIAGGFCFKTQNSSLIKSMWNHIRDYELNDSVVSVRGKTIPQLAKFRIFFHEIYESDLENEVISKFIEMRKIYHCDTGDENDASIQNSPDDQNINLEPIKNQNSNENFNIYKDAFERQYMQDILQENWIIFNKEKTSNILLVPSMSHSISLVISKNDIPENNDNHSAKNIKQSLTQFNVGLNFQKFKPVKIGKVNQNKSVIHRKSLGDSKLPPILYNH